MGRLSTATPPCPICGKPSVRAARPFCSRRCADIDLGRWLKGVYRMPGDQASGPNGADGAQGDRSEDEDA